MAIRQAQGEVRICLRVGIQELAQELCRDCDIVSDRYARSLVQAVVWSIANHLRDGNVVVIPGFGKFHLKRVGARLWRSPTDPSIRRRIKARVCPAWRPASVLKERCRQAAKRARAA